MLVEQAYERFQLELDESFENSKIAVDRGRFVYYYNKSADKIIQNIIDKGNNDEIRYLQKILIEDYKIQRTKNTETADYFKLPTNYFEFSSAYSKATNKDCQTPQKIYLKEIKNADKSEILDDEDSKPDFKFRQSVFTFSEDNLLIYKNNFTNKELFLSYYRYPNRIRLLDPNNPESNFDENHPIEFDDKLVDRIISMAISELKISVGDPTFQINKQQSLNKL